MKTNEFRIYLVEQQRQLTEEKDKLLKLLGDVMLTDSNAIMARLDEIAVMLGVIQKEFEKLDSI